MPVRSAYAWLDQRSGAIVAGQRHAQQAETLARLVEPWLQQLDPELFPLKHPLDARMNATLAEFFADADTDALGSGC